jgi:Gram-negative porin
MKKTLVALAVLAASGASFAQVTMTGEFTWGFKSTNVTNSVYVDSATKTTKPLDGAGSSGFGVDYSNINFTANEDLGGGTKVEVRMGIDGADRSNDSGAAVVGQNAYIALTNGASKLKLGTLQNDDYLSEGVAGLGNPVWINQDGHVFTAHTNADRIEYSYNLGAITLGYQYLESSKDIGEGYGSTGSANQARNLIQATYAAGPLTANLGLGVYNNEVDVAATQSSITSKSIARFAVAYDLGMAKLGLAYANTKKTAGSSVDTFLAVAVPLGNLTLGADWAQRKTDFDGNVVTNGATTGTVNLQDGTVSGYGIGVAYALSKRTQLVANYRNWEAEVGAASKSTDTRVYIDHSF